MSDLSAIRVNYFGNHAYYDMGGSSQEGYRTGASPFLIHEVAKELKRRGFLTFTLGVANRDGLKKFKEGLGADPVTLIRYYLNRPITRTVRAVATFVKIFVWLRGLSR
jgi:lipid II:glycine glycyltransferase (peptidoglycan interpeptide bridge formation enzyme)